MLDAQKAVYGCVRWPAWGCDKITKFMQGRRDMKCRRRIGKNKRVPFRKFRTDRQRKGVIAQSAQGTVIALWRVALPGIGGAIGPCNNGFKTRARTNHDGNTFVSIQDRGKGRPIGLGKRDVHKAEHDRIAQQKHRNHGRKTLAANAFYGACGDHEVRPDLYAIKVL